MKPPIIIASLFASMILVTQCGQPSVDSPNRGPYVPEGYELTFSDEFDSFALDQNGDGDTTWAPWFVGWDVHYLRGNSDDCYKAWEDYVGGGTEPLGVRLHEAKDGVLFMYGYETPEDKLANVDSLAWIGAMISANRSHSQTYGYFEFRARFAMGKGAHWAFWLVADDDVWPPELDMLEAVGHHEHQVNMAGIWGEGGNTKGNFGMVDNVDWREWHVYGALWRPSGVEWFIDGEPKKTLFNITNKPMYFMATLEMGSHWTGDPDDTTPWPATCELDYVRMYRYPGKRPAGEIAGERQVQVRAKGTTGGEPVTLQLDGDSVHTWTLSTKLQDYAFETEVDDANIKLVSREGDGVLVDYISACRTVLEAEDRALNVASPEVVTDEGGSECIVCPGYLDFGTMNISGNLNSPPSMRITSPDRGSRYKAGDDIVIEIDPWDARSKVERVEIFQNGIKIGEDFQAPWSCTWYGVPEGEYDLVARGTDDEGAARSTDGLMITVEPH